MNTGLHSHLKHFLGSLSLFAIGLIVALAFGELLIRYLAPQNLYRFPRNMYVNDPVLQYKLSPHFYGVISNAEYHSDIQTNSIGLREDREYGAKQPGTFRILALGDSFTMGVGVDLEEGFVKRVESQLRSRDQVTNYEVINTGVPGYDTSQELAYLQTEGLSLEPDLVLLNYYVGNDIVDNLPRLTQTVIDGYLRMGPPSAGFFPLAVKDLLQRKSHFYHFIWPYQRSLVDPTFRKREEENRIRRFSIYRNDEDDTTKEMWSPTKLLLKRFAELSVDHRFKAAVIVIPEPIQVSLSQWYTVTSEVGESAKDFRRNKPGEIIVRYCKLLGLPVLDLLPVFDNVKNKKQLYFPVDGHWTPEGNALAAENIYQFLDQQHLLGQ